MIAVSIVSHGHGGMVERLVGQLRVCPDVRQILVTRNIPESLSITADDLVEILDSGAPRGFGANHNAAFRRCREPLFCVLNPDIQLRDDPFPALLACLEQSRAALAAPLIVAPGGEIEDSIRHFPTLGSLALKALGGPDGRYAVQPGQAPFSPDWVAGMFMLYRAEDFARVGGFDERYFLYYEDVDICRRLRLAGMSLVACPSAVTIHDARRASHRNLRHMSWHLASLVRFLWLSR